MLSIGYVLTRLWFEVTRGPLVSRSARGLIRYYFVVGGGGGDDVGWMRMAMMPPLGLFWFKNLQVEICAGFSFF